MYKSSILNRLNIRTFIPDVKSVLSRRMFYFVISNSKLHCGHFTEIFVLCFSFLDSFKFMVSSLKSISVKTSSSSNEIPVSFFRNVRSLSGDNFNKICDTLSGNNSPCSLFNLTDKTRALLSSTSRTIQGICFSPFCFKILNLCSPFIITKSLPRSVLCFCRIISPIKPFCEMSSSIASLVCLLTELAFQLLGLIKSDSINSILLKYLTTKNKKKGGLFKFIDFYKVFRFVFYIFTPFGNISSYLIVRSFFFQRTFRNFGIIFHAHCCNLVICFWLYFFHRLDVYHSGFIYFICYLVKGRSW